MNLLKIEKAVLCGLLIVVLASAISGFSVFATQCDDIRGRVLRLHILANSDTTVDQKLKLNVRDKILAQSEQIFVNATSKKQAEDNAREKLPEIKKIAQDEIKHEGYSYKVNAELVNMYFTTRVYGDVTLPAGYYDAVRVTIGAAKGHNWWCVLYPSLCVPAAGKTESQKIGDVLTPAESSIVQGTGKPSITIKFKTVEIYQQFMSFLKSHGVKL